MCPKCREEVTSSHKCIRCGKDIVEEESFVNPNFDMDRYNKLAGHVEDLYKDNDEDTDKEELDDDEFEYDDLDDE